MSTAPPLPLSGRHVRVLYTTRYREGGPHLAQAARTLAQEKAAAGARVSLRPVETKRALVEALCTDRRPIDELHLITHSGMYGPMFGTTSMPEQMSPFEWRALSLPFSPGGEAFFHACRSGRRFAPFFARTFGVPASGHHWYTTLSQSPDRFVWAHPALSNAAPLYVVGQRGRRSHGSLGALGKHLGLLPPTPMVRHLPAPGLEGAAYDRVAAAYDATFTDIRVRGPEWAWLSARVPPGARLLDLGCGTGALLRALEDRGVDGVGADVSAAMLEQARRRRPGGSFVHLDGPTLPLPDRSLDLVVSLLSWRYVDWDPMLAEVARVLRPGGRLLVVDMVASPAALSEGPRVLAHRLRALRTERRFPGFAAARDRMVNDPDWARLLTYNPIRAEHEYRWFFGSRFPEGRMDVLDLGRHSRVLAFDSGPLSARWFPPQSYP